MPKTSLAAVAGEAGGRGKGDESVQGLKDGELHRHPADSQPAQGHHCRSEQPRVPLQVESSLQLPSINELSLECRCTRLLNTCLWLLSHCNRLGTVVETIQPPKSPKCIRFGPLRSWSTSVLDQWCWPQMPVGVGASPLLPYQGSAPVCLHVPRSPELLQVLPAALRVLPLGPGGDSIHFTPEMLKSSFIYKIAAWWRKVSNSGTDQPCPMRYSA